MKIDDFMKEVNKKYHFRAEYSDGCVWVCGWGRDDNDYIFMLPKDASSYDEVDYDLNCLPNVYNSDDLFRLFDLIHDYIATPVQDRFPEKKYRLRWIDDANGNSNYFYLAYGEWCLCNMRGSVLTESDLVKLKHDNPHLAQIIDATKEPVEDDNERN